MKRILKVTSQVLTIISSGLVQAAAQENVTSNQTSSNAFSSTLGAMSSILGDLKISNLHVLIFACLLLVVIAIIVVVKRYKKELENEERTNRMAEFILQFRDYYYHIRSTTDKTDDDIKEDLKKAGWNDGQVEYIFSNLSQY
jgi:hypothetical protein